MFFYLKSKILFDFLVFFVKATRSVRHGSVARAESCVSLGGAHVRVLSSTCSQTVTHTFTHPMVGEMMEIISSVVKRNSCTAWPCSGLLHATSVCLYMYSQKHNVAESVRCCIIFMLQCYYVTW